MIIFRIASRRIARRISQKNGKLKKVHWIRWRNGHVLSNLVVQTRFKILFVRDLQSWENEDMRQRFMEAVQDIRNKNRNVILFISSIKEDIGLMQQQQQQQQQQHDQSNHFSMDSETHHHSLPLSRFLVNFAEIDKKNGKEDIDASIDALESAIQIDIALPKDKLQYAQWLKDMQNYHNNYICVENSKKMTNTLDLLDIRYDGHDLASLQWSKDVELYREEVEKIVALSFVK